MSNLIPEKRTDKRGNLVTRWVRSFTKKEERKPIPAPTGPAPVTAEASVESEEQIYDIVQRLYSNRLNSNVVFDEYEGAILPNLDTIARYEPELLPHIYEAAGGTYDSFDFWEKTLSMRVISDSDPERLGYMLDKCQAALIIAPLRQRIEDIDPSDEGPLRTWEYSDIVDSITRGKLPERDDNVIAAVTMITYIKGLDPNGGEWSRRDGAYVDYDVILEDAKYMAENIEAVERILPELYVRNASDKESIKRMLSNPAPALIEGEL